jgi:putative ABC transport system ATP-binding protein
MIDLKKICKEYKSFGMSTQALNGVSLTIDEGEFISIMGASGSGKSTLLNIIGAMDKATSGEYYFKNQRVDLMKPSDLNRFRKNNISFVFQNFALMKHYNVIENIELPLMAKGVGKKERRVKAHEVIELVGLAGLEKKLPMQLSGGQQQRVAIARAIINDFAVLLADEPTGSLDKSTGEEIVGLLKKLNSMGRTIILVTHDRTIAEQGKRIIELSDGRVISDIRC